MLAVRWTPFSFSPLFLHPYPNYYCMSTTRGKRTRQADGGDQHRTGGRDDWQQEQEEARKFRDELPTRDYAMLVTIFNALLATGLLAKKCSMEPLPERI